MDTRQHRPATWTGIFLLLLAGAAAFGEPPPSADEALSGVQRWLDGTHDLQGRFEQVLLSGALGAGLAESGRVLIERPGRMRWNYLAPEVKIALVDGDRTRLYLAEDRQLWEGPLAEADSLLPVLLAGGRPLADVFEAELAAPEQPGGGDKWRLRLVPRRQTDALEEVVLVLRDPARVSLDEIEVLDAAGNRLLYRFFDLERNRGLPADAFQFEPPPGTDVVATESAGADR